MSRTGICQGHPAGWVVNDDGGAGWRRRNHTLIPAIIATHPRQGRVTSQIYKGVTTLRRDGLGVAQGDRRGYYC